MTSAQTKSTTCNLQYTCRHSAMLLIVGLCASAAAAEQKVVVPFDFVSKFDEGRYGRMVGEMIWQKLDRRGGFVIPESMFDTRAFCKRGHLLPSPDMPLSKMEKIVRKDLAAQIGIWGSVERVAGHDWDVYELAIRCVEFGGDCEPRIIYQCNARTKVVSEIPHVYVKKMLDALCDLPAVEPATANTGIEENWKRNPNLLVGDFQRGAAGVPTGWDSSWEAGDVNQRQRLGGTVQWISEVGNPANRVIRFSFTKALGDSTGVAYYGKFFPIEENARYRFQCRWRSNGPAAKVFIKCYAEPGGVRREVYRSQQNLKGPKNTWNTHSEDFTPKHTKYTPRFGRVMLYAYLGGGAVEFDDVVLKQIESAATTPLAIPPRLPSE